MADEDANEESTVRADPVMTVEEFVDKAKNLLDAMREEYVEMTGDEEPKDWVHWSTELTNAYLND